MDYFRRLVEILRAGEAAVLAIIVETKGSTPRETGAKMLIRADGDFDGTIGGGAGEAKVLEAARDVFLTGEKRVVNIDLTDLRREGICGGTMKVLLARWQGSDALALAEEILARLDDGKNVTLFEFLNKNKLPVLAENDRIFDEKIFVETIEPTPILLIVGAGHVGIELARIAASISFRICVQDERTAWANARNFPAAEQIYNQPIEAVAESFSGQKRLFIALVTRGFDHDLRALKVFLADEIAFEYLGMIGSARRVRQVFEACENSGFTKEKLAKIHAPIGLEIGALTPAEIAVSIAAQLIQMRRKTEK